MSTDCLLMLCDCSMFPSVYVLCQVKLVKTAMVRGRHVSHIQLFLLALVLLPELVCAGLSVV